MENLRQLVFALIIFSGVIVGMTGFYIDLYDNYSSSAQDISDLEVTAAVDAHVNTLKSSIEDTQVTGITLIDIPFTIASGVYNTFKLLFASIDIYQALMRDFVTAGVPIPGWAIAVVTSSIAAFMVFEIISAIAKWKV